jgi:hypothetical protein
MELDDMKQAWGLINRRLELQQALNLQMFRDGRIDRAHKALRPLRWGQVLQIVIGSLLMLVFAPYWVSHRHTPHLLVYGLCMHAYGLLFILTAARNLYLQSRLDYVAPVLEIQRRIAALREWRLHEAVLHGVVGCFIWVPLMLLGFQALGADVWVHAPAVVWWNLTAAAACVLLFYGIVRFSRAPGRERLKAALDNSAIGRSVRNTQALVEEIARFESAA